MIIINDKKGKKEHLFTKCSSYQGGDPSLYRLLALLS